MKPEAAGQVAALLAEGQPRDESSAWRLRWEDHDMGSLIFGLLGMDFQD